MLNEETNLRNSHYHMLGVGGMGMAPLAIFLKQAGCRITGDDDNFHPRVHQLLLKNDIELIQKVDFQTVDGVIHSNALGGGHPSLKTAVASGAKIMRRGEFLAELSKRFKTVAVAGSHGKSTTCAMLIHGLSRSGFPCNYILGGLFSNDVHLPGYYCAESPWLIIEVDESDGSINSYRPTVSLLVNVDWDHADFYDTKKKCVSTFQKIINRTKSGVFINNECKNSKELTFDETDAEVRTFGEGGDAQLLDFKNRIMYVGGSFPRCAVPVPFEEPFNAHNALAALSVVRFLTSEIPNDCLENFPGLWRRQEVLYQAEGFQVLEDYGHHPAEIDKLFEAIQLREGPLVVVFQPHRFSRTLQFKHEFAKVLSQAHQLIVMEVYGAGESPIEGGTGTDLFEVYSGIAPHRESYFCADGPAVLKRLQILNPRKGVLLFLGAGNIHEVAADYVRGQVQATPQGPSGFYNSLRTFVSEKTLLRMNEPLAQKTTLRVGGHAEFYAEPTNETDLQVLLRKAEQCSLPVNLLGRGSNLIVPDSGVRGLVIRLSQPFFQEIEMMSDGRVRAAAGVRLKELCGFMRKQGVSGFEFLEGIPGNVGGALRMNAGAMGGWMSDVISEAVLMNYHGDIFTLTAEQLHFGYRLCRELIDSIGLAVIFKAGNQSCLDSIQHTMDTYQTSRKESQPRQPSAGCTFKNPKDSAAGMLVDQCELKGFRVGGAEVSDVHANFIINTGNATASDVIALINEVRKQVYQKRGYVLEPEVILFGDNWKDYLIALTNESCPTQSVSQG